MGHGCRGWSWMMKYICRMINRSLLLIIEAYVRAQFKASLGLCEMSDRMRANAIRRGL